MAIEAAKVLVLNPSESGVDGEIIELQTANNVIKRAQSDSSTPSK